MARRQVFFQHDPQRYAQAARALAEAEAIVRNYKAQRFDVSQAENFLFIARSSLERNDYDDVFSCSQKAIDAAKRGMDFTFRDQILKQLSEVEHDINESKSKGINMSAPDGLVQQAYSQLNNREYEAAKKSAQEACDKLKATLEDFAGLSDSVKYVQTLIDKSKGEGAKTTGVENLLKQAKFHMEWGDYAKARVFVDDATNALRELSPEAKGVVEAFDRATKLLDEAKKDGLKVHKAEFMLKSAKQSIKAGDLEKARQNAENAEHIINKSRKMAKQAAELMETFEAVIQHAKANGSNVTKAEHLLKKAQISLQQGSYGTAIDYATEAEELISDSEKHVGEYKTISEKLAEYDTKIKDSSATSDTAEAQKLFNNAKAAIRAGKFGEASDLLSLVDKSIEEGKKLIGERKKAEESLARGEKIIEDAKNSGINVSAPLIILNEAKMVMKTGRYQKVGIFVEEIERLVKELGADVAHKEPEAKTPKEDEKKHLIQIKSKKTGVQIIPRPVAPPEKKEPILLVLKGKKKEGEVEAKNDEKGEKSDVTTSKIVIKQTTKPEIKSEQKGEQNTAQKPEIKEDATQESKPESPSKAADAKPLDETGLDAMAKAKDAVEKVRTISPDIDLKEADQLLAEIKKAIETKDRALLAQCNSLSERAIQAAIRAMNEYMAADVNKVITEVEREMADAESQGVTMATADELVRKSYSFLEKKRYKESREAAFEAQEKVRELKRQFALAADITSICQLIITNMKEDHELTSAEDYLKHALSALVDGNYAQAVASALDVEKALKVAIPECEKAIDALHASMVSITEAKEANLKVAKADYFMKHARNAIKIRNFEKASKYAKDAKRVTAKIHKQYAQAKEAFDAFKVLIDAAKRNGKDVVQAEAMLEKAKYSMDIGLYGEAVQYAKEAEAVVGEKAEKKEPQKEGKIAEAIRIAEKRRESKPQQPFQPAPQPPQALPVTLTAQAQAIQLKPQPTQAQPAQTQNAQDNLCPNCSKPVKPEWAACPFCRNPLREEKISCPGCKREIKKDWRACPFCKTVFSQKCKNCGKDLQEDWAACPFCKTKR